MSAHRVAFADKEMKPANINSETWLALHQGIEYALNYFKELAPAAGQ